MNCRLSARYSSSTGTAAIARVARIAVQSVVNWPNRRETPEHERLLVLRAGEDQREPHVVPDRQHRQHGDGRDRRAEQRHDDAAIGRPFAGTVDARRLEHVVGDLIDEPGEDEHGDREAHRHVDRDQAPIAVDQADPFDHANDVDRGQADRDHQPGDEGEVDDRRRSATPLRQGDAGHRADDQHDRNREPGDDDAVAEQRDEAAAADRGAVSVERPLARGAQRRLEDLLLRLERVDHEDPDRPEHDQRPQGEDEVREAGRALHGRALRSLRDEYSQIDAPAARIRNVTVAIAAPRPALGCPVGGSPEMPVR